MNGQGSIVKVKNEMSDITLSFQTLAVATILNITSSVKQPEKLLFLEKEQCCYIGMLKNIYFKNMFKLGRNKNRDF